MPEAPDPQDSLAKDKGRRRSIIVSTGSAGGPSGSPVPSRTPSPLVGTGTPQTPNTRLRRASTLLGDAFTTIQQKMDETKAAVLDLVEDGPDVVLVDAQGKTEFKDSQRNKDEQVQHIKQQLDSVQKAIDSTLRDAGDAGAETKVKVAERMTQVRYIVEAAKGAVDANRTRVEVGTTLGQVEELLDRAIREAEAKLSPPVLNNRQLPVQQGESLPLAEVAYTDTTKDDVKCVQPLIDADQYLAPYLPILEKRWKMFRDWKHKIEAEGGMDAFSRSYERFGIHIGEHATTYHEWAPHPVQAFLVGDFNNWNDSSHPMENKGFGHWEISIPHENGQSALKHMEKVKVSFVLPSGERIWRLPAWINFATQDLAGTVLVSRLTYKKCHPFTTREFGIHPTNTFGRMRHQNVQLLSKFMNLTLELPVLNQSVPRIKNLRQMCSPE
jgi:hypothetical protein